MPELRSHTVIIGDENDPNVAQDSRQMLMAAGQQRQSQAIELQCDTNEEKILNATIKALSSGSLTPLIKEELRCTIQSRRLAEGKGELKVEFKSPPKKKEMTEEERVRYMKRRVQNREAAQRFRQKQKDTSDMLTAKIKRLEHKSRSLLVDLNRLREEKESLKEMLKSHLVVCTNQHRIPSILSSTQLDHLLSEQNYHPAPSTHPSDSSVYGSSTVSDSMSMSPTESVSTSCFSVTSPTRPGTADSSVISEGDVFYYPDEDNETAGFGSLGFMNSNEEVPQVEVFIATGGDGQFVNGGDQAKNEYVQTFELGPSQDISFVEEIVIDSNADFSEYARPDSTEAMRLDSCSSVDTSIDGRGLSNSIGTFSSSNLQTSCFDNSFSSTASTTANLDNSSSYISMSGFNSNQNTEQMYYSEEGQSLKTKQEMVESLIMQLTGSTSSDFDISAVGVVPNGDLLNEANGVDDIVTGLAESTSDLRHSLAFAYSRVHDSCEVDIGCTVQDYLLKSDAVP